MENPLVQVDNRKRKLDHEDSLIVTQAHDSVPSKSEEGLDVLQFIIDNDILKTKLPTNDSATSLLIRWFRTIASDQERLRVFRQWVSPSSPDVASCSSPDVVRQDLTCISNVVSIVSPIVLPPINPTPTSQPSSSASLSSILADTLVKKSLNRSSGDVAIHGGEGYLQRSSSSSSTGTLVPDIKVTTAHGHQVLNVQHQGTLQSRQSPSKQGATSTLSLFPKQGSANTLLTATLQGDNWHACSPRCECTLHFTAADGIVSSAQRIPGGTDGVMLFMVPHVSCDSNILVSNMQVSVRLVLCIAPTVPVVCSEPFIYTIRERSCASSTGSDDDSEGSLAECDEDEGSPPPQALPPLDIPTTSTPTPKQMMTIRERMLEHVQKGNRGPARLTVLQQPSVRVVWKNRRLDAPFKLRVECVEDNANLSAFNALSPSKLVLVGVVADHKGRLQIDAAENFIEDFSSQSLAHFSNLRMTKGTWGKEWTITFAAVVKASMNNPVVVGVSPSCPIVVKTRKNPQVRHNANRAESSPSSSPTVTSERKYSDPSLMPRIKRHRVEDLLDNNNNAASSTTTTTPTPSHFEDMASLLAAAEMKQHEQLQEEPEEPSDAPCLPMMVTSNSNSGSNNNKNSLNSSNDGDQFANFQSLMTYLDDIRLKRQISIGIIDQPVPKRDSKALIVKKGKPFRVPFSLQLKSSLARAHNPQDYVCVAVVRNDKGEEVAVRNSEVPFDWRGVACFAGLMVMKGTWGKTVRLTFEARWSAKKSVDKSAWSAAQKMMVVSETSPIPLMCYTKDKKGSPSPSG